MAGELTFYFGVISSKSKNPQKAFQRLKFLGVASQLPLPS